MANIESTYTLDVDPVVLSLEKVINKMVVVETKLNELSTNPFKEATAGASQLDKELSQGTKAVAELDNVTKQYEAQVKELTAETTRLRKEMKGLADAGKYKQMESQVKALKEEIKKLNSELKNTSKTTSMMSRIKGGILGAITGNMTGGGAATQSVAGILGAINPVLGVTAALVGSFAEKAFAATSQWQGYSVALKNSLGSQELANQNLSVLEQLAVRLPVGLNEVTESFNQLVNRGFKPTKDELANLSGFAAAQNKTFDQLIQAILDAEQGELERLKEFGIQASNEGNKVSVTFRGVTKTFEKGAKDSASAFAQLAKELGSDALNADKMQTLEGRMSNLGDQADRVSRKFGEILLPVFETVLSIVSGILNVVDKAVTGWTDFDKVIAKTAGTAGNSYPILEKLLGLFSSNDEGRSLWQDFFFSLSAGFEKIVASAEALLEIIPNIMNPKGMADAILNWRRNMSNINEAIADYYATNPNKQNAGDFVYGPGGGTPKKKGPSEAELKQMEARKRELTNLEQKLADELLKIENEYGKERLEALKDNELEYIEAKRKYDLAVINQEQQALLKLKQLVSGARKGMYDRNGKVIADQSAQLTSAETAPFDFRRQLVDEQAAKDRADFINKAEKEITQVLSNEYQRQLQDVEYKYEELFKLAKKSGVDITKLEKEKQKELAKINSDKDIADLEKKSLQEQGDAEINIVRAQIEGRTDLEIQSRQGLLEIEKKYLLEKIKLIEASGDPEAQARIQAIRKTIGEIDLSISELNDKAKQQKGIGGYLQTQLGMTDDQVNKTLDSAELFASKMGSIMSELYQSLNRMSEQRIQRINDEISKKEDQVKTEQELNEQGVANNLSLRLKELADLKEARERAIEDQKRLQRTQLIVDTATQASSMITAASKVYSGFAGIPIVGVGLGIAAVALMLGAFAAAKIKAFQLVNQQTPQFKKGGRHTGRLHSEGGEIVEVERDEWTINRRSSIEHDELLEAINNNDRIGMLDYMLRDLIGGTGVTMTDVERRSGMRLFSDYRKSYNQSKPVEERLDKMIERLEKIENGTNKISRYQGITLGNNKVLMVDTLTGSKSITDFSKMVEK